MSQLIHLSTQPRPQHGFDYKSTDKAKMQTVGGACSGLWELCQSETTGLFLSMDISYVKNKKIGLLEKKI